MNHIYRIVYNQATGTYQAVAEFVKNRTVLGGGGEKSLRS